MTRRQTRAPTRTPPVATSAGGSLFGREAALASLHERVAEACDGRGAFVLLSGEAGIGKTALAEAAAAHARARGFELLFARGNESAGAPAQWLWVQVLRGWLGARDLGALRMSLGADAAFVAELLPELGDAGAARPALDAEASRFRLHDAVSRLLLRSSAERPLLLLLDDLQWADPSALGLLAHLCDGIARHALLVVATLRSGEVAPGTPAAALLDALARRAETIALSGLDAEAVARLGAAIAEQPLGARAADALLRRTEGNPLHVRELVRLARSRGETLDARGIEAAAPPAGVRHAVERRLDRVSPRCRRLLAAAAVLGPRVRVDRVAELARGDASTASVATALDEAAAAGLLVPEPGAAHAFRFAHDVVREVLYAGLDEASRVRLHFEAAELLEMRGEDSDARVAELARHYFEARAAGAAAPAAHWACLAGDRARSRWAGEEAARQYRRALEALAAGPATAASARCDLELRVADALRQTDHAQARDACREAARLARDLGDSERLARAALLFPLEASELSLAGSFDAELAALLEESAAGLGGSPVLDAQVRARLAPARPDRLVWARDTERRARRLDDPETLATALTALHWSLGGPEHAPERLAIARELIEIGTRERRPLVLVSGVLAEIPALLELGERTEADFAIERIAALAGELALPRLRMNAAGASALQAFLDGDLDACERRAAQLLALGRAAHSADARAAFGVLLLAVRPEQGRIAELEPLLRPVAAGANNPVARLALGWVRSELGRGEEAREPLARLAAQEFRALPRDAAWSLALHFASESALALGDAEIAARVHAALLPCADRGLVFTGTSCFGSVARHLGALSALLEQFDEAEHWFERGLAFDARLRAVPWLAWGQIGLARVLERRGRAADAARADALRAAARQAAQRFGLRRVLAACDRLG